MSVWRLSISSIKDTSKLISCRSQGKRPPISCAGPLVLLFFVFCLEQGYGLALTGVCALMNLEVLAACEDLAAAHMGTGEGLLAGMNAYVIDQFVLGLEGAPVARAPRPVADVRGALGSADVLHRQMRNDLLHRMEHLIARFVVGRSDLGIRIRPKALHVLLDVHVVAHKPNEGTSAAGLHLHGLRTRMRIGMGAGAGMAMSMAMSMSVHVSVRMRMYRREVAGM